MLAIGGEPRLPFLPSLSEPLQGVLRSGTVGIIHDIMNNWHTPLRLVDTVPGERLSVS